MNHNWLNFLGLALSAGVVITGEEMVVQAVRNQKVYLVILAEDISQHTFKKVTDKCRHYNVECIQKSTSDQLGHALGKSFRKVIGITDRKFAVALKNKINK